ncbi:hypothetical protein ACIQZO_37670 [Streptomyces sp. NPDC097617]|uniref:hypothetical protein n=1 Tax=Streptomyces sp. NPDC097617 TaxID=3366091 RepID=UPI00380DBC2D
MAVTAKDDLYTLTPDHSALWRRSGSQWEQISGPAGSVYAGRAGVFITRPGTNTQISKYNDETRAWEPIVEANGSFAITGDHLYHLTPDGIGQWDGEEWTGIGGPAKNIYAGGAGLFATNPDTDHIYKYGGKPNKWTEIGGPGATFASGHDRLYAITPDHSAVYEWTGNGTDWTRIGGPAKNIYAGGAGLFATNPDTGHIYQYNGTPDSWTEIGGPGATFTVSDTQLYGLTPDRSATYRWDGKADWTRIGGPENAAELEEDDRLLRENCQPASRDCVKELRDAEKILETSLTDWLKDNSLEFLLDTFDINDIRDCADADLNSCLTTLLDAGSVILGVGAYKKAKNTFDKAKGLHEFAGKAKEARDTYNNLRKIIDTARKAKEKLPKEEEQQRQEPCPVDKGPTHAKASAHTAGAMRHTPATSAAPSRARPTVWLVSAAPSTPPPPAPACNVLQQATDFELTAAALRPAPRKSKGKFYYDRHMTKAGRSLQKHTDPQRAPQHQVLYSPYLHGANRLTDKEALNRGGHEILVELLGNMSATRIIRANKNPRYGPFVLEIKDNTTKLGARWTVRNGVIDFEGWL